MTFVKKNYFTHDSVFDQTFRIYVPNRFPEIKTFIDKSILPSYDSEKMQSIKYVVILKC